jgi:phage FluMu protein Com
MPGMRGYIRDIEATGVMKISFRIECPHCKWGYPWNDNYVNQGWMKLKCPHCEKTFFNKVTVTGITVESGKELPEGVPCHALPEAKEADEEAAWAKMSKKALDTWAKDS